MLLFISYDKFNGIDYSALVVGEVNNEHNYIYKIFYGKEADNIYDLLTTQNLKIINGTGYWKTVAKHSIDGEHPSYDINVCSECNTTSFYPTPYCSHCGAKMVKERPNGNLCL